MLKRPLMALCLCVAVFIAVLRLCGAFIRCYKNEEIDALDKKYVSISGTVFRRDSKSYYVRNISFYPGEEALVFPTLKKRAAILIARDETDLIISVGSRVCIEGKFRAFSHATNPGEFDPADYYAEQGIIGKLTDIRICSEPVGKNTVLECLSGARENFETRLYKVFPDTEASILSDLLLGDRAGLDSEIKSLYSRSGIAHILSISALHVSILGMGIYSLLRRARVPVPASAAAGIFILVMYGIMTGMSISACRAIGMYILKLGADVLGRTEDRPTSLALVCTVLSVSSPSKILSCGFLLSFGAVAGISFVSPALTKCFKEAFSIQKSSVPKPLFTLYSSLIASFSATVTTLPIVLYFFYEVPVYGVFLNVIILPCMSFLMVSALIAMLIPGFGIAGTPAYFILKGFETLCLLVDKLPGGTWNPGRPAVWSIVVYYAVLVGFVVCTSEIVGARRERIRVLLSHLPIRLRRSMPILLPLFSIGIMISLMSLPRLPKNTLVMLDVGQGDGMIYYTDKREVYLIDGGSSSNDYLGEYIIKPALKYYGFSHIDAAFVSHSDTDHLSGLLNILENRENWGFRIDEVVLPGCVVGLHKSASYYGDDGLHNFDELVRFASTDFGKRNVVISYMDAGDIWASGRNRFICLHPASDFSAEDPNEMSECILVDFFDDMSTTLLLTGDIQGVGEDVMTAELQKIMSGKPLTMLKVAHHGSKYSTPADFLEITTPHLALISAGRNNFYGHPHKEVLSRLEDAGCAILSTKESGAIILNISENRIKYHFALQLQEALPGGISTRSGRYFLEERWQHFIGGIRRSKRIIG